MEERESATPSSRAPALYCQSDRGWVGVRVGTGWGGVGDEIGCLDLCLGLSVSRDCTVSSSGDSASGPRPRAALGNFGRNPPLSSRRGPSTEKPGRCPFGLGRGVWHREQVGPALPVCDSFLFIINLGDSPRHRRVSNGQLFERLGVRPLHVICLGVSFQIWPLQESLIKCRLSSCQTCGSQSSELEFLDLLYRHTSPSSLKGFSVESALAPPFPLTSK